MKNVEQITKKEGYTAIHMGSSDEPMIYMVIQSKENSLGNYSAEDGKRTEWNPKW